MCIFSLRGILSREIRFFRRGQCTTEAHEIKCNIAFEAIVISSVSCLSSISRQEKKEDVYQCDDM